MNPILRLVCFRDKQILSESDSSIFQRRIMLPQKSVEVPSGQEISSFLNANNLCSLIIIFIK